jgi:hypothetical protein
MKLSFRFGLVAALAACSGETDQSTLLEPMEASELATPDPVSPANSDGFVPRTADEMEAEFLQRTASQLSEQERAIVEAALIARGTELSQARIVGRMIAKDDAYESADDILDMARASVEKGLVSHEAENDYARLNGTVFEMRKPYFGRYHIKIVVPNTTIQALMNQAVDAIENAADDCITSSTFSVMLQSDWDALQVGQADYPSIRIVYGPQDVACPLNDPTEPTYACANLPSFYSMRLPNNTSQHRLGVGYRIGVNSALVINDSAGVSTMTHELLHTLGFEHTYDDGKLNEDDEPFERIRIPGTMGAQAPTSIMDQRGTPTRSRTMSSDDIISLDTVYSPKPGGTCAFTGSYEATCAPACTKVTAVSVAGDCCWCGGGTAPRHFVRSTFNANTYLCVE